ncbi:uncharacterized protein EI97DRAFT_456670 [Westerdykella ornata]|uniref:Aminoglycoside phosphotransferase domain-containing protein n=1 Tax=Westerdykella ornata TaxID=318751 RepID=A0A6A6JTB8_WESOR|nr:uncharacterized protein EI97DRAFT_456670 [Westerdykella ornata]KAF2278239.1 hypothetical protein EI97DRAFT_456670 [Westerdykella ornata]
MAFAVLVPALRKRNSDEERAMISRAETIAHEEFPGHDSDDILLEHLRGGSFNRVVAIKICEPEKPQLPAFLENARKGLSKRLSSSDPRKSRPGEELILRAPRRSEIDKSMWYNVVTLAFLARRLPYPVPRVILHNIWPENPLEQGYMIQERLPGIPLVDYMNEELPDEQLFAIAEQVCQVVVSISSITHHTAGIIGLGNTALDFDEGGNFFTTPQHLLGPAEQRLNDIDPEPCRPQTTVELLLELCDRRRKLEYATQDETNDEVWEGFSRIIRKLHQLGFLPDDEKFHFCHRDFQPRNMLTQIQDGNPVVTGILDWDSAAFVPKFVSMRAPFFLWSGYADDEWDEYMAVKNSERPEYKQCKLIFEKVVGPEFLRYAYSREYIIARRVFNVIEKGIYSRYSKMEALRIIADFKRLIHRHSCC